MASSIVPQTKCCSTCGLTFPATLEYFHKKTTCRDGLNSRCKNCQRPLNNARSRAWAKEHPDRIRAAVKRYEQANPEKVKARHKEYRWRNRADYLAKNAAWRDKNRESINARVRVYSKTPKERSRLLANITKRRAREYAAEGSHTYKDTAKLMTQSKGRCYWCGEKIVGKPHIDHIIPLARGGSNGPENLCVSCPTCNLSKGAKLPSEWTDRLL
jgi:5-methylcytosine-specific restriction endonuclease McrA